MLKFDIVIVNWNAGAYLNRCLSSVNQATVQATDLVASLTVVDNGSTDHSLDGVGDAGTGPLRCIANTQNRGFGAACNQGAAAGSGGLILFLNPDAAVSYQTLAATSSFMSDPANARVGICGVRLVDDNGQTSRSCSRFPSLRIYLTDALGLNRFFPDRFVPQAMCEWDHETTRPVDQIMGAYFCIRRPLFEALGGFDERFFVYSEEVDLSYRAFCNGYTSMFLASVAAYHKGGASSGNVKARRLFYYLRSRMLYSYKHFALGSAVVFSVTTLFLEPMARLIYGAVIRRSLANGNETYNAYGYLWCWFPQYLISGKTR
ncbi:MAG: hypothetical protein NVSMB6_11210 [Burkholderiaceae bacterium]